MIDMPTTAAKEKDAEDPALLAFLAAQVTRCRPLCGVTLAG